MAIYFKDLRVFGLSKTKTHDLNDIIFFAHVIAVVLMLMYFNLKLEVNLKNASFSFKTMH